MSNLMPENARRIWCADTAVNQCAALRHTFTAGRIAGRPRLLIAAGTDYVVWVNGSEVGRGQYSDFADRKTYTEFALPILREGDNTVAVLAYHCGENFFTCIPTDPGVILAVLDGDRVVAASGDGWKAVEHAGWRSGPMPRRSPQVCFTSEFTAGVFPDDWTMPGFDDSAWPAARVFSDGWRCIGERPVPVCRLGALKAGRPVKGGTFRRTLAGTKESFACIMAADEYFFAAAMPESAAGDDGVFAVYDLGEEAVGFIAFELEAPAGTVVDYAHGEHLDDGLVRMQIGDRSFADRFTAAGGISRHQLFFHRVGARYLQFNISNLGGGTARIRWAGVLPWEFPLPEAAGFACDDLEAAPLRRVAKRTLELCMHEHYEDCPWREQSMYAYDSRNQALYGYYLWGNYAFVRASFSLLGYSYPLRDDHLMMLCAPMVFERTIPIFSFVWVTAAWENYLYSGDRSLFDNFREMVADLVAAALSHHDQATGLYHTGTKATRWNFYEWSPGLEGDGCRPDEFHAGYNFYILELLENYARLLGGEAGEEYRRRAAELRRAVDACFWDETRQAYASKKIAGEFQPDYHDHMQYLALLSGVAAGDRVDKVVATLRQGELHYATLSALPYLVNAMMPVSPEARAYVAETIRRTYGAMLEKGATSLWETQSGGWDFGNAGSLCHGWSSLPIYYQGGAVLGVKPLEPGFARFEVRPYADSRTHFASGSVPTPAGEIRVAWQRRGDGLHLTVEHPAALECVVGEYPECPLAPGAVDVRKV